MNPLARAIFVTGIIFVVIAAVTTGRAPDATGFIILSLVVGVGLLGIALVSRTGRVQPATCSECNGLISPNAPYCKHCGAPVH